ncbi:Protoglobin-domain-containing protein [Exophiala viscosa]|uniref:Protoglobin-domain-containing protein n=1 Tax=Exophiala viscosa TaxID=2486360 RepID=UPI00219F2371|nr:Protoglobin-domain-containing protein [Exophiala viscosa]
MMLPDGMRHLGRRDLYTSLHTRVTYLLQFLEFGPNDVAAIVEGQKYIKAKLPDVVDKVYRKVLKHDLTARIFCNHDTRDEENPLDWAREADPQIKSRKMKMRWYLTKLFSDPTKSEYWEYLDKVGLGYVGKGRPHPVYIDYIFLGAALGHIQDSVTEAIFSHTELDLARKIALVRAFGKVIWIQNDLMAKWHVEEGKEYCEEGEADRRQSEVSEPDGFPDDQSVSDSLDRGSSYSRASSYSSSSDEKRTSLGRRLEQIRSKEARYCSNTMEPSREECMERQRAAVHWRPKADEAEEVFAAS